MPIRKAEKKLYAPPPGTIQRTGDYARVLSPPQPYKPIQPRAIVPSGHLPSGIPSISTRDLGYFFDVAASLYKEDTPTSSFTVNQPPVSNELAEAPPVYEAIPAYDAAPPEYAEDFSRTAFDTSAILVLRLFRQTRIDIYPIAERFHIGPADRQPLYSLTAQPSIRSGTEFNELIIKRRDPIHGVWYHTCTSDIEPSLDLARAGNWKVAKLVLESMPVWKKVVAGSVTQEEVMNGKGNSLRLSWGDRKTLGPLGDAYGLWWDNGTEVGLAEAFYLIEGWQGFDSQPQGLIRVRLNWTATVRYFEDTDNGVLGEVCCERCAWPLSRSESNPRRFGRDIFPPRRKISATVRLPKARSSC